MKYKVDVSSYLDAYKSLQEFKNKYDKIKEKLKNLTLKGNTKYSFLISERDNKMTTTPEDPAYNFEVEAYHLRQIINISICVLEKQMQTFKKTLYKKYQADIIKFRKGMVSKNMKNIDIWKEMQDLVHI